jgi:cell division protein ZipA
MPELRWTLLIIGVLFIAVLAWWERRRPHQASRHDPSWGPDVQSDGVRNSPNNLREPTLTLPEIRTETRAGFRTEPRSEVRAREPVAPRELPVVEIDAGPETEVELAKEPLLTGRLPQEPPLRIEQMSDEDVSEEDFSEELEEISEEIAQDDSDEPAEEGIEDFKTPELAAGPIDLPPPPIATVKPIVDWPPDDQRKVVSIRLVARPPDRFRGTLVRQALNAEGFVLGDLDIFHKPDPENRAVLSAASLTKPGTFDLDTMDTQRYSGLNLFAVLPGPKSPRKTFEELLTTARMLNERLEGALQDERGGPLTPMRIQALRDAIEAEAKS